MQRLVKGNLLNNVKVMVGCLVLIPDSEATQQQHQQYQRQQAQLREIKQQMQALITGFAG
ncbi:hypothetical protein F0L16_17345 [Photorhabdus heterorhabditis]|uniref:Uncharacterized protein n=1 Tax=Photorhabdus heterorhabditis TaxID=880156 RepID=A0A5B0W3A0_9GAMM|nr:hypothetical protein F0L16_17345 [Photorhabdus heterorhabditis]